jgi:hypothetical protein
MIKFPAKDSMQHILRFLFPFILLWFVQTLHAQRVQILPGSRLVYEVEDWGKKYKYIVTVKECSDSAQVLEWKTEAGTVYKGKSVNEFIDIDNADRLLIKPNMESEEWLDEYTLRLRPPALMEEEIEASADTLDYGIDAADALLIRRTSGGRIKDVLYNGQKINFEFRPYNDLFLGLSIGFMPFGARYWWLYSYKDENILMRLIEITTVIPPPAPLQAVMDSIPKTDTIPQ